MKPNLNGQTNRQRHQVKDSPELAKARLLFCPPSELHLSIHIQRRMFHPASSQIHKTFAQNQPFLSSAAHSIIKPFYGTSTSASNRSRTTGIDVKVLGKTQEPTSQAGCTFHPDKENIYCTSFRCISSAFAVACVPFSGSYSYHFHCRSCCSRNHIFQMNMMKTAELMTIHSRSSCRYRRMTVTVLMMRICDPTRLPKQVKSDFPRIQYYKLICKPFFTLSCTQPYDSSLFNW